MAAAAVGVGVFLAQSQHGSFPRPVTRLPAALVTTTTEEKLRRDSATRQYMVTKLTPGGSAAISGNVRVGDVIVQVDGRSLERLSLNNVRSLVMGQPGTPCTLTLSRKDPQWGMRPVVVPLIRGQAGSMRRDASPNPMRQMVQQPQQQHQQQQPQQPPQQQQQVVMRQMVYMQRQMVSTPHNRTPSNRTPARSPSPFPAPFQRGQPAPASHPRQPAGAYAYGSAGPQGTPGRPGPMLRYATPQQGQMRTPQQVFTPTGTVQQDTRSRSAPPPGWHAGRSGYATPEPGPNLLRGGGAQPGRGSEAFRAAARPVVRATAADVGVRAACHGRRRERAG
ncbi:hypothetical protein T484DRAFT_1914153, partial [Baffinella frigidus]